MIYRKSRLLLTLIIIAIILRRKNYNAKLNILFCNNKFF